MVTVQFFEQFPRVLEYYQKRFNYILVDEYQDTNHAQYRLLRLGGVQHVTNTALKSYLVQQLTSTLEKLREEINGFEQKYGGTFTKIKKKMERSERFARSLDLVDKAWGNDFLNWEILCREYC